MIKTFKILWKILSVLMSEGYAFLSFSFFFFYLCLLEWWESGHRVARARVAILDNQVNLTMEIMPSEPQKRRILLYFPWERNKLLFIFKGNIILHFLFFTDKPISN